MSSFPQFDHLRVPLEDIKVATNNFSRMNLIGTGGFGRVYKGQLLYSGQLIHSAIKRLDRNFGQGDHEFWSEITVVSDLKHENIASIIGFCDEDGEKILITEYAARGSLERYLSDPSLTWKQRLKICVGVARALSYIHYDAGRSYGVIHRDIKSSNVLLQEKWEAKVSGFALSIKFLASRRHRLVLDNAVGTVGYADPIYVETGSVTQKSDVYSFGVVLFEVLCGRRATGTAANVGGGYESLATKAIQQHEEGKLDQMINPNLRDQMDPQSMAIFSDTAYHCLKRQRTQRPDMEQVVNRLKKALELQLKHENPELILKEHLKAPHTATSSNNLKVQNLAHLKIKLADIMLSTENFADKYCIGSGGYGMVYKGELDYFDSRSLLEVEVMNTGELPKSRSSVAIKRIFKREDGQAEQGFFAEIEMLTSCKHRNVVSLLGFCDEGPELILVYEYASNGSLDEYLGSTDNLTVFTWVQRIKMCLDIAHGLSYLHNAMEEKQRIIHRDIKSANILLGENWEAKIADFGLSRFHPSNQQGSTLITFHIAGTEIYLDPEYLKTGKLKKESDIYSLGVVLFEIFCGRLAYDEVFNSNNDNGLPSTVRRLFREGTLKEILDPKIKEENDVNNFTFDSGPNQESLETFSKIAYQCLAETQVERPPMEVVIKELEKALYFQENHKDSLKISLEDIKLATQNFSDDNLIGQGGFGKVYKGEVKHANGHKIIAAKRLNRMSGQGEPEFLTELEILLEYKNENVIGFVGYCLEMDERIIVYEYAFNRSLDRHLSSIDLTWIKRLEICIDVASGLEFFHGCAEKQEVVILRDIKSSNILLTEDWKAKLTDFGLALISPIIQEMDYLIKNAAGTFGYCDPLYIESGLLSKESDIYSFGIVLFEILCGRLELFYNNVDRQMPLSGLVRKHFNKGTLERIVLKDLKYQIGPKSFTTYSRIAYQCLHRDRNERPTATEVVVQLKQALEFQEDHEIWGPKLPKDYKEIIEESNSPEIYYAMSRKDLYNMFCKGILLQKGKVWFSLGANGERNEMISAKFSFKNHRAYTWQSIPESRFQKVAAMLDISKLKTQIKIKTQFLSPGVRYGVYLVFKFCSHKKVSSTPMYVNLTYKIGNETLHSYFATWRDHDWMMIELGRFLIHEQQADFKVILESFSRYYCKNTGIIYIEGIEFRAIDNVIHEKTEKPKEVEQGIKSYPSVDEMQQSPSKYKEITKASDKGEKNSLNKPNRNKCHMILAKEALYDTSNAKLFCSKPVSDYRFEEVIELRAQQVLHIRCKIGSYILSPNTEYSCYLVFKLSEKCRGLHCPVIVRNLLNWKNKETGILYLRAPTPLNRHEKNRVPEKRVDGWMEVIVWQFNSNDFRNGSPVNLKLICYEGTMSGLIVSGINLRPVQVLTNVTPKD